MYAVLNLGYKPSEFARLPLHEKMFLIACIDKKIEAEKAQQRQLNRRK